ncbi:hypothetical protein BGW80DRAFT_1291289 [Lactifluus volemus]|nr:hypothetical protein BGW80DRAFT_1291289 [Lactifluus volemus]
MVSRHVFELCTSPNTLIAALEKAPDQPISKLASRLFNTANKEHPNVPSSRDGPDLVAKCGNFPYRPSGIFLQIYNDVLHTLDTNPLAGLVSPPLLGTSGVVPLSIISVIPDIMKHYANLIVRAEAEIILATNYWELSQSSGIIADSLRELSKSVEARGGEKVVMKLMYDRGNLKQAVKHRILVDPAYWGRVGLPSEDEIPGISLEVVNYHHPLLGTFHAKYLVVDRRVACLNSNNVQDRPNVEMMVHLEGPIVESIYDMALLTWSNAMSPPLPLVSKSPKYPAVYKFQKHNEDLKYIDPEAMSEATRAYLQGQCAVNEAQGIQPIATVPEERCHNGGTSSDFCPHILHKPHDPVPIAIVNRSPKGRPGHYQVHKNPQDVAWLSAVRYAQKSVFMSSNPNVNASPIVSGVLDACRRGVRVTLYLDLGFNDQSEIIPFQGGTNEEVVHKMYTTLHSEGNGAEKHLEVFWYTAIDQIKPLSAALKKRNCHVKFMAVDDQIAILGSGNQSWFHSQEVNIMVDSPELVSTWLRALDANQNTRLYGRVSDIDGVWRGNDGEVIQASGVAASSFIKRLKGLWTLMRRISGSGRF